MTMSRVEMLKQTVKQLSLGDLAAFQPYLRPCEALVCDLYGLTAGESGILEESRKTADG
jgi:hypothetical protein